MIAFIIFLWGEYEEMFINFGKGFLCFLVICAGVNFCIVLDHIMMILNLVAAKM